MIIAEIGQNHCGDMSLARYLVREARDSGADLVKFQLYNHKILYKDEPNVKDVTLTKEQALELFNYGREIDIEVFFSVFDVERVRWCEEIGVKRYKIATSQNTNYKLLEAVGKIGKETFISSQYIPAFVPTRARVIPLYCIPEYPAINPRLDLIDFDRFLGYSDHTVGIEAAKQALKLGAKYIEKHFAIDHETGIDAPWSMTPDELKELKRFENVCRQVL